jgi:hypothetical protein
MFAHLYLAGMYSQQVRQSNGSNLRLLFSQTEPACIHNGNIISSWARWQTKAGIHAPGDEADVSHAASTVNTIYTKN